MKTLYVKTRVAWRKWLAANHGKVDAVWLVFYRKGTGQASLDYEAAVEEALCYGWVDSIVKKLDDKRYARKFTPRKATSVWSESNRRRVARLVKNGSMTKIGLAKVEAAKRSGGWAGAMGPNLDFEMPPEFARALGRNKKAKAFFESLAPTYRKQYVVWISMAKRKETKAKRIRESVSLLERGEKLGLR
jgi:uncharacterized protein YdeI (YjbR/CyaY-like superfamily)